MRRAGRLALLITGLNMGCILPLGVFSAVLIALERFDVVSGVTIVVELTRAAAGRLVPAARLRAGRAGPDRPGDHADPVLGDRDNRHGAVSGRCDIGAAHRESRAGAGTLFGFSIYRFIWIVANQLIFYSDALVIGIFLGAGSDHDLMPSPAR